MSRNVVVVSRKVIDSKALENYIFNALTLVFTADFFLFHFAVFFLLLIHKKKYINLCSTMCVFFFLFCSTYMHNSNVNYEISLNFFRYRSAVKSQRALAAKSGGNLVQITGAKTFWF